MAEKKRTSDSSEDKVLDDMTNDFDDVFSEIKDKNDVESKKNQLEEESAIRGIFGRIKKKNSNQKNSLSETEKKTSSMNLSDSQEILDLSKEVTGSAKEEAVVVVKAEEESNGVTTITMKIPKLTDEKLAEIIAEQKQADMTKKKVEDKPKEDVQTEKKSSETKNQDLNSEVDSYKKKVEDLTNKDKENNKNTTEDIVYKECTYTRTYEFKDYYNYNTTDENSYFVVLDTYLSKTGPIIEKVTTDIFPKNFAKDKSYEITYHTEIRYDNNKNIISQSKEIVSIKKTDKTGMEQEQGACVLK